MSDSIFKIDMDEIERRRIGQGLYTQAALADRMGMSRQKLHGILKTPPAQRLQVGTLAEICRALRCHIGDLIISNWETDNI